MSIGYQFRYQYAKNHVLATPHEGRAFLRVLYQTEGPLAWITFNVPEKKNVLNDAMLEEIFAALHKALDDDAVRVVILRGAGGCFSAGLDLAAGTDIGEIGSPVHPNRKPTVREYYGFEYRRCTIWHDIEEYAKPTVAMVEGYCLGAGYLLAGACDVLIAAEDAQFGLRGFGEFPIGLYHFINPWPGDSEIVKAGRYTPEVNGRERAAIGLVTRAVPATELEPTVRQYASALAAIPPDELALTKELVNGIHELTGLRRSMRAHFQGHLGIQWVRWREGEVNFYRLKRDKGWRGFLQERERAASAPLEGKR
jgi:enoyl-CoA hydratase